MCATPWAANQAASWGYGWPPTGDEDEPKSRKSLSKKILKLIPRPGRSTAPGQSVRCAACPPLLLSPRPTCLVLLGA